MIFLILKFKKKKKKILLIENLEYYLEVQNKLKYEKLKPLPLYMKNHQIITHTWIPGIISNRYYWNRNKKFIYKKAKYKPSLIIAFNVLNNTFIKESYRKKIPIIVLTDINLESNYSTYKIPCGLNKESINFFNKLLKLLLF